MNKREFYDYIVANFTISGEFCRLLNNVLNYAEQQGWTNPDDLHQYLSFMLDGTIGLTNKEICMANF